MAITKTQIKKMQKELAAIAEKYGMVTKNRASYGSQEVNFSIGVTILDNDIVKENNKRVDASTIRAGLAPIGTKVMLQGEEYTIVKARRVKYVIRDKSGKQYVARFEYCQPA